MKMGRAAIKNFRLRMNGSPSSIAFSVKNRYIFSSIMRKTVLYIILFTHVCVFTGTPEILEYVHPQQKCCCTGCSSCSCGGNQSGLPGSSTSGKWDSCRCVVQPSGCHHSSGITVPELSKVYIFTTGTQLSIHPTIKTRSEPHTSYSPVFTSTFFHPPPA